MANEPYVKLQISLSVKLYINYLASRTLFEYIIIDMINYADNNIERHTIQASNCYAKYNYIIMKSCTHSTTL